MDNEIREERGSTEGVKYSGDVTISLMDGDRVISKQQYHNTGCAKLFSFLANCICGEWSAAKAQRPCRIVLFTKDENEELYEDDPSVPSGYRKIFNESYWTTDYKISTKIMFDTSIAPRPITKNGTVIGYSTSYHFRVPYLCLVDGSVVYKFGLYPNQINSYVSDLCAYYIVDKDCEIKIPTAGGNFTVIVDWTLKVVNAEE